MRIYPHLHGSDQVEKIKTYYDDGTGWILFATIAFEYDGDKLMEVLYEETEGEKSKTCTLMTVIMSMK